MVAAPSVNEADCLDIDGATNAAISRERVARSAYRASGLVHRCKAAVSANGSSTKHFFRTSPRFFQTYITSLSMPLGVLGNSLAQQHE
jgi:hypothetical protein